MIFAPCNRVTGRVLSRPYSELSSQLGQIIGELTNQRESPIVGDPARYAPAHVSADEVESPWRRTTRRCTHVSAPLAILFSLAGCGDSPARPSEPAAPAEGRLDVVSGADVSDTIGVRLPEPLVVEVRDSLGEPVPGTTIVFRSTYDTVMSGGSPLLFPHLWLDDDERPFGTMYSEITRTTDNRGQAEVHVEFAERAAPAAGVRVEAADLGYRDIAKYTVEAGRPLKIVASPEDSTLYVDSEYALRTEVQDRAGNVLVDSVVFSTQNDAIVLGESGAVRGSKLGRATVAMEAGGIRDSVHVSVVPRGVIAAWRVPDAVGDPGELVSFRTDGSEFVAVRVPEDLCRIASGLHWQPGTDSLVFAVGDRATACHYPRLYTTTMTSPPQPVIADTSLLAEEQWPHYDPTGNWIYFTALPEGYGAEIWRVRTDGTGAERVGPDAARHEKDSSPSPSADGSRILFASDRTGTQSIQRLDLQSGTSDTLPLTGHAPRGSPDENLVAFWNDEAYYVGQPDGTGEQELAPSRYGGPDAPSWSPDGAWVVVVTPDLNEYAPRQGRLALVRIATGEVLPLAWTSHMTHPSWRP